MTCVSVPQSAVCNKAPELAGRNSRREGREEGEVPYVREKKRREALSRACLLACLSRRLSFRDSPVRPDCWDQWLYRWTVTPKYSPDW